MQASPVTPPQTLSLPMIEGSTRLGEWMRTEKISFALTTIKSDRLMLLGLGESGRLRAHIRQIPRCQGMVVDGKSLWIGAETELRRYDDALSSTPTASDVADRRYSFAHRDATGDVDIHDIAIGADGQPIFVNTAYSCLAVAAPEGGFAPLWQPPFISELKAEDRCHLNGLALDSHGKPAYVTAFARTDVAEGWREHRTTGGMVLDVASGEAVCTGLVMPHSPRVHNGRLWVLNSGTGELGTIDPASGKFEAVCFCPGYVRGLSFFGKWAVVGLSRPRQGNSTFNGLPLDERLAAKGVGARCGFVVVDTDTGTLAHALSIHYGINEVYDVALLAGVQRPETDIPATP